MTAHKYTSPPKVSPEERSRYLERISYIETNPSDMSKLSLQSSKRLKVVVISAAISAKLTAVFKQLTRPILNETIDVIETISNIDCFVPIILQSLYILRTDPFDETQASQLLSALESGLLSYHTSPKRRVQLFRVMAYMYWEQYEVKPSLFSIKRAIFAETRVLELIPCDDQDLVEWLDRLGRSYRIRFEILSQPEDIYRSINHCQHVAAIAPHNHPELYRYYNNLGVSYQMLYNSQGRLEQLEQAVYWLHIATLHTPDGHPNRFHNLGYARMELFRQTDRFNDLQQAALCMERVSLSLAGENHHQLRQLILSRLELFRRSGDLDNLKAVISHSKRSLQLITCSTSEQAFLLCALGDSYVQLFERSGETEIINRAIDSYAELNHLIPDNDEDKPLALGSVGFAYHARFRCFGNHEDLELALCFQEQAMAILHGYNSKPAVLYNASTVYLTVFNFGGRLEHLDKAIDCIRQAVLLAHDDDTRKSVWAYGLANAYRTRFYRLEQQEDIDKAIDILQETLQQVSENYAIYSACQNILGTSYQMRFLFSGELEDIDMSIECQRLALHLAPDNHPERPRWLIDLGSSCLCLFNRLGNISDLNNSISYTEKAVRLTPDNHPERPHYLEKLGDSYLSRFERLGALKDLSECVHCFEAAATMLPNNHKPRLFLKLGSTYMMYAGFSRDFNDLLYGIFYQEEGAKLLPDDHPEKPVALAHLAATHYSFHPLDGVEALKGLSYSLDLLHRALYLTPTEHPSRTPMLDSLGHVHSQIFEYTSDKNHKDAAVGHFKDAALSTVGSPHVRLKAAIAWAQHSTEPLSAYMRAMILLPQVVWLGTSVERRYECLASDIRDTVTQAAAVAISNRCCTLALEWLEEGRNIVWNQMLQLRAPLDELFTVNPNLANKIRQTSRDLDRASTPHLALPSSTVVGKSLQQAAQQHRRLAVDWDKLLEQARRLPGFHGFLRPKPFSDLLHASQASTVVVINLHSSRCDAIALRQGSNAPVSISLSRFSLTDAQELQSQLFGSLQGSRVQSRTDRRPVFRYDKAQLEFEVVLATLWANVVKPILGELGYLSGECTMAIAYS
ncbi:hypothetical protein FRC12_023790 [Ceratobasidium sp. 428]|nr:hypothetical protein FRC12_023790 [Ceratobasidium sp. 428]